MLSNAGVRGNPKPNSMFCCDIVSGGGRPIPPGLVKNCELDLKGVPYPTFKTRGEVGGLVNSSVIRLFPFLLSEISSGSCSSSEYS